MDFKESFVDTGVLKIVYEIDELLLNVRSFFHANCYETSLSLSRYAITNIPNKAVNYADFAGIFLTILLRNKHVIAFLSVMLMRVNLIS